METEGTQEVTMEMEDTQGSQGDTLEDTLEDLEEEVEEDHQLQRLLLVEEEEDIGLGMEEGGCTGMATLVTMEVVIMEVGILILIQSLMEVLVGFHLQVLVGLVGGSLGMRMVKGQRLVLG